MDRSANTSTEIGRCEPLFHLYTRLTLTGDTWTIGFVAMALSSLRGRIPIPDSGTCSESPRKQTKRKNPTYLDLVMERYPFTWQLGRPGESQLNTNLQTLEGHSSNANSVAISHDSTRLASASSNITVKI
ncbi:hypothetical protein BKA66DRAFT_466786 [Pyrenochaeta sp. MPI-SDFR-AT-0127]|nr:hypothetical protein BKA66DRAFT_466786 [Pyrenochaeta sp. MPI-SDFR-AT-0127]